MVKAIRMVVAALALASAGQALAYQVTGEVKAVSPTSITVGATGGKNKGEKFEITRGADTKVTGDLKVGAKVTVEYTMTARVGRGQGREGRQEEVRETAGGGRPRAQHRLGREAVRFGRGARRPSDPRARILPVPFDLQQPVHQPTGDQPRAIGELVEGAAPRRPAPGAARRHRLGQDLHHRQRDRRR